MKICPQCNRSYADESLRFCLDDGGRLLDVADPEATKVIPPHQVLELPSTQVWRATPPAPLPPRRSHWLAFMLTVAATQPGLKE